MKKLIIENKKNILLILGVILLEVVAYLLAKLSPIEMTTLQGSLDNKIPFISFFVYFYIFWYLVLFFVPFLLSLRNKEYFKKYITTWIVVIIVVFLIYIFYPTTMIRQDLTLTGKTLSTFLVGLIYKADTPILNCFPSMHCLTCFLFIIGTIKVKEIKPLEKVVIIILSNLIILSTLFIKQHMLVDVVSALVLAILIYVIVDKTKLYEKFPKQIKKSN